MITQLFALIFLALIYGLTWHNRSARELRLRNEADKPETEQWMWHGNH
jgi:hypothetical protein